MGIRPTIPARREIAAQLSQHEWDADQREYSAEFVADELAKFKAEQAADWPHRHCCCEICG